MTFTTDGPLRIATVASHRVVRPPEARRLLSEMSEADLAARMHEISPSGDLILCELHSA